MDDTMSTLTKMTRTVKKLEVPRPLKSTTSTAHNRNSVLDVKINSVDDLIVLTEAVAYQMMQGNYDRALQSNVATMYSNLKLYGAQLEALFKDFLDRYFVVFRNGSQDERLDKKTRLHLLELIELRAKHWQGSDYMSQYYRHRGTHAEPLLVPTMEGSGMGGSVSPTLAAPTEPPTLLGPGEVIKPSGKFPKPTKIPGKNYSKDEVVIRNADSGKVMGIKGRRVHMIEELSDTIISFQRVSPGAKERLVQITGPNEENVNHAKHLIGDTIRRNASPVRLEGALDAQLCDSRASLDSAGSDEAPRPREKSPHNSRALLHSFSTNDAALGEYKYTVTFGQHSIKITGHNLDLVKTAKLVLDEYFESASGRRRSGPARWRRATDVHIRDIGAVRGLAAEQAAAGRDGRVPAGARAQARTRRRGGRSRRRRRGLSSFDWNLSPFLPSRFRQATARSDSLSRRKLSFGLRFFFASRRRPFAFCTIELRRSNVFRCRR
ncbi:eukaryotic translation initiation factor 4E-binding protein Mextli isoform X7 [Hyposmocoma kahamanoa]|uniref:eukaryotic translation initiation factor 4E-binding protein Mextli isoform X7 n=1 Tax=Hyposmocoma kahamanoa TaxID=1477025 RepID=UPI000E6D9AD6|nr:eukaryotic translation initiation factor 4E-binding protein Mextli isoform X7 [Hyposmocoma kahamanoa]